MTRFRLRRTRPCDEGRIRWGFVLLALVVLIAAAGFASYRTGVLDDLLDDPDDDSALDIAPPEGLTFPAARAAQPVLADAESAPLDRAAATNALGKVIGDSTLGKHNGFAVGVPGGGNPLIVGSGSYTPASTLKNFTTLAALQSLGTQTRFDTTVVRSGGSRGGGESTPELTLVGGGDPLLATKPPSESDDAYPEPATLSDLAAQTADALGADGVSKVELSYDDSLFKGPDVNPHWEASYISTDVTTPVSALLADGGVDPKTGLRTTKPAAEAAALFAERLRLHGIDVRGDIGRHKAAASDAEIASVSSPTLGQIVEQLLDVSNNEAAEIVLRQLAIGEGEPASFEGGVAAVKSVLTRLGVPWSGVRTYDGSGLSRDNRVTPQAELAVLRIAATSDNPDLHTVLDGLPIAGFSGSLIERFTSAPSYPALGFTRAKTGTLTGIHAYAGMTTDRSGDPLLFVAIANDVKDKNVLDARAGLDEIAAALTDCDCTR